jgi:hypothetical protein
MFVKLARDKSTTMPAVDPAVDTLCVWHCRYQTLRPIGELRRLESLVIATFPDDSLEFLGPLKRLRDLRIMHLPRVSDLAPLAALRRLETLGLSTLPSWDSSGRVTKVKSLAPLAKLPTLKHLAFFGVVPRDKSLAPLTASRSLVAAQFSKYPRAEVKRFYDDSDISDDPLPALSGDTVNTRPSGTKPR